MYINNDKENLLQIMIFNFFSGKISEVTRAMTYSYEKKMLSELNKLGIFMCIPKAGKPKRFFKKNGDLLVSLM